jgi:hypothetical protein
MGFHNCTVSVVIPTLNEAKNLPLVLPRLPLDIVDEVILVDGRSTDGSVEVARELLPNIKVVLEPRPGKGMALRAGYRASTGDIIVVIDADGSNDPREIPRFLRPLLEGADFAKGSRFAHRGGTTDMPRYRQLGNAAFVHMVNLMFCSCFTDLCYGYHAFWRYCLDSIDLHDADGFEIDTVLYLRALVQRLRIVEVPSFEGYRFFGVGKLKTIPDGIRVLRTIIREWVGGLAAKKHQVDYPGFRSPAAPLQFSYGLAGAGGPGMALARPPAGTSVAAPDSLEPEMHQLLSISQALTVQPSRRELLRSILRLTLDRAQASSGSILMIGRNGEVLDGCVSYGGVSLPMQSNGRHEIIEEGLAGWVVRNRKPVLIHCTREDPRWLRRSWDEAEDETRSAMGVPIMTSDRVFAVLTLVRTRQQPFTEADLQRIASLAQA